ncbi:cobyrinate a,c-diamide synthase [Desulfoscipio sp. XC116]|uniref:cobyrinate a,c-diamide synthase n=1 Tax=Desulfoscipio sp. XC116 TaxID=3144975 RepID=UPI00325BA4B8
MSDFPRLMIAGTHSGVGKTTIAAAVMAMLSASGMRVQPYKVGPDYIDPGFHQAATGWISRNLDTFFLGEDGIKEVFTRSAAGADISVIEGVMGLYDGIGSTDEGSSARVAQTLQCPVVLVIDARSMAHSAAAMVWGYANLPGGIPLAGVILNRVGSSRHLAILTEAIEGKTGVPVLGGIGRENDLHMPERHLGLVPSVENRELQNVMQVLGRRVARGISGDKMVSLARRASALVGRRDIFAVEPGAPVRLGIVRDNAFNFYYQDGLDLLEAMGAELQYCSALNDACLPDALDGLYIGGGFPEVFMEQLSVNTSFINDLRRRVADGMPIYAECGGLMYLCAAITDFTGRELSGAGILPAHCRMEKKRVALGYVEARALRNNVLVKEGAQLRGHEFHYSSIKEHSLTPAFVLNKPGESAGRSDGHVGGNVLATYLHVHFAGSPPAARGFLDSCARYRLARKRVKT